MVSIVRPLKVEDTVIAIGIHVKATTTPHCPIEIVAKKLMWKVNAMGYFALMKKVS